MNSGSMSQCVYIHIYIYIYQMSMLYDIVLHSCMLLYLTKMPTEKMVNKTCLSWTYHHTHRFFGKAPPITHRGCKQYTNGSVIRKYAWKKHRNGDDWYYHIIHYIPHMVKQLNTSQQKETSINNIYVLYIYMYIIYICIYILCIYI